MVVHHSVITFKKLHLLGSRIFLLLSFIHKWTCYDVDPHRSETFSSPIQILSNLAIVTITSNDLVYLQEQYESEEIDEEIFYTIPQLQQMNSPRRIKRKISNEEDVLWSGGIVYYEFDSTHSKLPVFITKGKSSSCNCNRPVHHQPNLSLWKAYGTMHLFSRL